MVSEAVTNLVGHIYLTNLCPKFVHASTVCTARAEKLFYYGLSGYDLTPEGERVALRSKKVRAFKTLEAALQKRGILLLAPATRKSRVVVKDTRGETWQVCNTGWIWQGSTLNCFPVDKLESMLEAS